MFHPAESLIAEGQVSNGGFLAAICGKKEHEKGIDKVNEEGNDKVAIAEKRQLR